jgi:hypothetical protein
MLEHPRTALSVAIALTVSAAVTLRAQAPAATATPAAHASAPGYVFRVTNALQHVAAPGADDPPPDDPTANNTADAAANGRGGRGGAAGRGGGGGAAAGGRGAGAVANGPTSRLVASVQTANGKARFDVSGLMGASELNANQSLLTTDSAQTQTLLDLSAHTYQKRVPTTGTLVEMVTALDAHSVVWMVHVDFDTLGKDTVEGRLTQHYQLRAQYTTEVKDTLNQMAPRTAKYTTDYWVADLPIHFFNPFLGFAWPKPGYSPGLKVWIDKLEAAEDLLSSKGLVVKVHSEAILGTENPKSGTYVREIEVTGISQKDVDLSELDVPDGYKPGGRGRGGGGTPHTSVVSFHFTRR